MGTRSSRRSRYQWPRRRIRSATATPEPALDPHGERRGSYGLRAWPPTALQPLIECDERMLAHSDRLVLPRMIAPAARSLATSGASRPVTLSFSAREPAVVAIGSAVSILSLIRTGTPASGPSGAPDFRARSARLASTMASGLRAITARKQRIEPRDPGLVVADQIHRGDAAGGEVRPPPREIDLFGGVIGQMRGCSMSWPPAERETKVGSWR